MRAVVKNPLKKHEIEVDERTETVEVLLGKVDDRFMLVLVYSDRPWRTSVFDAFRVPKGLRPADAITALHEGLAECGVKFELEGKWHRLVLSQQVQERESSAWELDTHVECRCRYVTREISMRFTILLAYEYDPSCLSAVRLTGQTFAESRKDRERALEAVQTLLQT